ncbi:glycosyltransferase 87 family protein [Streptomyces sp. NBC_00203]|uniref:glycosyltransferase 87 family protein n=1 Tax=Streptomyces sp. NBC_00203 TaxID=2975680 RepID=UPI00324A39E9
MEVTLLALSFAAFCALCVVTRAPMADALVYRAEGAAVLNGTDLYGFTVTEWQLPATYPPFAALLFMPTAWLAPGALKVAFVVGNVGLLAVLVRLSCRFAGLPVRLPALCAATAFALWLEPVFQTVLFGQINLAVVCLILWDLTRPPGAPGKGIALGIAAGVKLTPAVFIAYLLLRRRRREAAGAASAFAATVLLGALALPAASVGFWTRRLYETGRVGKAWIVDNQSLQGLIARALGEPAPGLAWALPAAAVGCAGLWLAARRAGDEYGAGDEYRAGNEYWARNERWAGNERWGILGTAFTALLISPISWSHHWVWCVPLIAVLYADGRLRQAATVTAVFAARTLWLIPHQGDLDLRLPWWQQPLAAPYPLLGLLLLAQLSVSVSVPVSAPVPESVSNSSASMIR